MPEDSALLTRASIGPKYLTDPAPDREEWQAILRFLKNAPCHDDAYPFRVVICEDREMLGEIFLAELPEDADEAAQLDGATKAQEFRYIILPFLKPIIIVMTLLNIGNIFRADFGLFFNVPRNVGVLYPTTDVIDTYVYRALTQLGDVGMSAAVGLVQSVVGFVLILVTNLVVRKIDPESALF